MKKNIFLLVLDGARADRISYGGYHRQTTPFIDALAERGKFFKKHYTVNHSSLPTHISLFTGVHSYFHKASSNHSYFDGSFPYLTKILQKDGYTTVGISTENPYFTFEKGFIRNFDRYVMVRKTNRMVHRKLKNIIGEGIKEPKSFFDRTVRRLKKIFSEKAFLQHLARFYLKNDLGGRKIIELIKEEFDNCCGKNKPFFIFANIVEAHTPFLPPDKYRNYFSHHGITDNLLRVFFKRHHHVAGRFDLTEEEQFTLDTLYDNGLRYTDSLVQELFEYLEKKDYLKNTIVLITSDHGEMLNEHDRLIGHGASTYEGIMKVPLLIYDKENEAKEVIGSMTSLIDIFPTILEIARCSPWNYNFNYQGRDLLNLKKSEERNFVISECPSIAVPERLYAFPEMIIQFSHVERTIIKKEIKLIWRSSGNHAIYDLKSDPREINNLFAHTPVNVITGLLNEMIEWYKKQIAPRDFFSLEYFDYKKRSPKDEGVPLNLSNFQDREKIILVHDKIKI